MLLAKELGLAKYQTIKQAITDLFGCSEFTELRLLEGGKSSSQLFYAVVQKKRLVIRVMGLDQDLADREQQITCLKIAAEHGIAPKCYDADANAGLIIMEFIEAKPFANSSQHCLELARLLRKLHQLDNFPPAYFGLFDYINSLINALNQTPLSAQLTAYFAQIAQIQTLLKPHLIVCAAHNDLHESNILFDGSRLYLIDWEAAGGEDPFFDLAAICTQLYTNQDQLDFLRAYFGKMPEPYHRAKICLMQQIGYCYTALHFLQFAVQAGLSLTDFSLDETIPNLQTWSSGKNALTCAEDYLLFAKVQIKTSLQEMQTLSYQRALSTFEP